MKRRTLDYFASSSDEADPIESQHNKSHTDSDIQSCSQTSQPEPLTPNVPAKPAAQSSNLHILTRLFNSPYLEILEVKNATKHLFLGLVRKLIKKILLKYKCIKIRQELDKCTNY